MPNHKNKDVKIKKKLNCSSKYEYDRPIFYCPFSSIPVKDKVEYLYVDPVFLRQVATRQSAGCTSEVKDEDVFFDCTSDPCEDMQTEQKKFNVADAIGEIMEGADFKRLRSSIACTSQALCRCFKQAYQNVKKSISTGSEQSVCKRHKICDKCLRRLPDDAQTIYTEGTARVLSCEAGPISDSSSLNTVSSEVSSLSSCLMEDKVGGKHVVNGPESNQKSGKPAVGQNGKAEDCTANLNPFELFQHTLASNIVYQGLSSCETCAKLFGQTLECLQKSYKTTTSILPQKICDNGQNVESAPIIVCPVEIDSPAAALPKNILPDTEPQATGDLTHIALDNAKPMKPCSCPYSKRKDKKLTSNQSQTQSCLPAPPKTNSCQQIQSLQNVRTKQTSRCKSTIPVVLPINLQIQACYGETHLFQTVIQTDATVYLGKDELLGKPSETLLDLSQCNQVVVTKKPKVQSPFIKDKHIVATNTFTDSGPQTQLLVNEDLPANPGASVSPRYECTENNTKFPINENLPCHHIGGYTNFPVSTKPLIELPINPLAEVIEARRKLKALQQAETEKKNDSLSQIGKSAAPPQVSTNIVAEQLPSEILTLSTLPINPAQQPQPITPEQQAIPVPPTQQPIPITPAQQPLPIPPAQEPIPLPPVPAAAVTAIPNGDNSEKRIEILELLEELAISSPEQSKYQPEEKKEILSDLRRLFAPKRASGQIPAEGSHESVLEDIRLLLHRSESPKSTLDSTQQFKKSKSTEVIINHISDVLKPSMRFLADHQKQVLENLHTLLTPASQRKEDENMQAVRDKVLQDLRVLLRKTKTKTKKDDSNAEETPPKPKKDDSSADSTPPKPAIKPKPVVVEPTTSMENPVSGTDELKPPVAKKPLRVKLPNSSENIAAQKSDVSSDGQQPPPIPKKPTPESESPNN